MMFATQLSPDDIAFWKKRSNGRWGLSLNVGWKFRQGR